MATFTTQKKANSHVVGLGEYLRRVPLILRSIMRKWIRMPIVWALVAIMIVFGLIDLVDDLHSQYSDTLDSLLDNNPIKIPLSDVTLNSDTRPVRSSSSSSSNTLNRDKYYAKKFSSRSNSLGTAAVGLPSVKSRISTLDCRPKQFTCLIKNLYFINKEFHVYVGSNFELAKLSNVLDSTILTGIGFGSHSIRFRMADSSSSSFSQNIESETLNLSNFGSSGGGDQAKNSAGKHDSLLVDTTQIHYINIHTTLPPESDELPENIDYYLEPTSFFSVLWSNLFRTIYAGVGAWYTQMSYNVFFTEHHRFVLIENNQKSSSSSKFTRILQAVTQFPVWNLDTLGDCIFRAGVMGIDRDVQVGEINNELGHDEYRFHLRSVAFRSFCDHLKEQILDKPLTSVQHRLFHSLVDGIQDTKDKISHLNSNSPRVSLILRKGGGTRQLLNDGELITALSNLPIKLKVYEFDKMSLRQQIHAIDKTDILIAMHGAALTHTIFLKPGACVIELFPYAFRKLIFQNLARIVDVKYQYWQNTHISKTVFNWTHVAANRLTDLPKEKVVQLPINWYNMDSKNYWRNQHTIISVEEVKAILEFVLDEKNRVTNSNLGQPATSSTNRKFLMFMPWEQLNNQILGVKSACAVSNLLNRTLVLPYLGYKRITGWKTQRKYRNVQVPFVATDYEWKPFDRYYNASKLLSLPCSTISLDNFISWNNGQSIQEIRYHPLGGGATSEKQLREYYSRVLGLTYESVEWDKNVYFQLRKEKIFRVYGNNSAPVMALGSMFMHYDFGLRQNYPIQKFYDYLSPTAGSPDAIETGLIITTSSSSSVVADGVDINYLQILKALDFSDRLKKVRDRLFDQHRIHLKSGRGYVAIHLRRGDYLSKCNEIKELIGQKSQEAAERAFERCFVPAHLVNQVVPYLYPPETYPIIYVATNADKDAKKEMEKLKIENGGSWSRVIFLDDLLGRQQDDNTKTGTTFDSNADSIPPGPNPIRNDLDPNDLAILDMMFCIEATGFIGNMHSSLSRHIIEARQLQSKPWKVF